MIKAKIFYLDKLFEQAKPQDPLDKILNDMEKNRLSKIFILINAMSGEEDIRGMIERNNLLLWEARF